MTYRYDNKLTSTLTTAEQTTVIDYIRLYVAGVYNFVTYFMAEV